MNAGNTGSPALGLLGEDYDLGGQCSVETHYYQVQTEVATRSSKGVLKSTDIYRERLLCEPGDRSAEEADKFTCAQFSVQREDDPEVTLPSLQGFSCEVDRNLLDKAGFDEQGQLYGIPEAQFEGLIDGTGAVLPFDLGYQVFSLFFYYHSNTDYAEPAQQGKGVQHLRRIGDKVVTGAAFA